jgi:predicted oxidoreductase
LLQSRMKNPLVTNQIEINLAENKALINGDPAYLQQHSIAPMAWSPLGGGVLLLQQRQHPLTQKITAMAALHGVDPASIAIVWLLKHPAGILPIMGSNTIERIKLFAEALRVDLDRQSWFELLESASGTRCPKSHDWRQIL